MRFPFITTLVFGTVAILHAQTNGLIVYQLPTHHSGPNGATMGPDGAIWFTECFSAKIGRITSSGHITEYSAPTPFSNPWGITSGPDGALWFTESSEFIAKIGRITTGGAITEYQLRNGGSYLPRGITTGPDG